VAGHADRLAKEGWKVLRRGAVEAAACRIDQPDPSRTKAEQIDDESERRTQRALDVRGAVQRLGNVLENAKVTWPGSAIS
jgi:hypothetical protein